MKILLRKSVAMLLAICLIVLLSTVIGMEVSEGGSGRTRHLLGEIHELTGMVFLGAALIHSILNSRQLSGYFRGLFGR